MRVLFIVDGDMHEPAARARGYQLAAGLTALGAQTRVLSTGDRAGAAGKRRLLPAIRQANVVVLQRVLPPRPLLEALVRINPAVVFDFDDALYVVPSLRNRLRSVLEVAVEVVAGNEVLAQHARGVSGSVTVVPTVVDPDTYKRAPGSPGGQAVRLGWIGTQGNLVFLEALRPALGELIGRGRSVELRVISRSAPRWPELPVAEIPWTLHGASSALAELDIGLAPLPDTPWTRGKCGFKALEYMASGLPVVAAPVGALGEIVVDGETGLLATGETEWVEHLDRLVLDPGLRRRLGMAGRRRVEQTYSLEVAAPALLEVLERAVDKVRRSSA